MTESFRRLDRSATHHTASSSEAAQHGQHGWTGLAGPARQFVAAGLSQSHTGRRAPAGRSRAGQARAGRTWVGLRHTSTAAMRRRLDESARSPESTESTEAEDVANND